ncbi:hypothetical protein BMS3Bbin04_00404 [bacterium BMS3Bbin04]|nr:hypothetical protein BMS3Bbin04_00404 [bacterium BMS3Bbin04]
MWFSSNATGLTVDETLVIADLIWLVLLYDSTVSAEFTADTVGQGMRMPSNCSDIEITAVSGTVKVLRMIDGDYGMTKVAACNSGDAISATTSMKLYPGDFLVFGTDGIATVKFSSRDINTLPYTSIPIGLLIASTR